MATQAEPQVEQPPEVRRTDYEKGMDMAGAVSEAIAALEAIGELGCFDSLPPDEADHAAHNRGAYLLAMVERTLRAAVRDFDGSR